MKNFAQLLVLILFTAQSTLALPAHHRIQAQVLDAASGMESAAEQAEAELARTDSGAQDAKWVQKLAHQLETRGYRKFMKQMGAEVARSGLSEAQKAQALVEADRQAGVAIPAILEKARSARNPLALVRQLKREVREAREQAKATTSPTDSPDTARASPSKMDRAPAQAHAASALLTLALAVIALGLLLLALSLLAAIIWYLLPVVVIGLVIYIVV